MENHGGILNSYLSKKRQSEKAAYCMILTIRHFAKDRKKQKTWGEQISCL